MSDFDMKQLDAMRQSWVEHPQTLTASLMAAHSSWMHMYQLLDAMLRLDIYPRMLDMTAAVDLAITRESEEFPVEWGWTIREQVAKVNHAFLHTLKEMQDTENIIAVMMRTSAVVEEVNGK